MLAVERHALIFEHVNNAGSATVAQLSRLLEVTEETIRRDLQRLTADGRLTRTHGGVIKKAEESEDVSYQTREVHNIAAKRTIARLATKLIHDANAITFDSSSTVYEVLAQLEQHQDLTIITNSVRIISDANVTRHTIISVGGELRRQSMTFVGPLAVAAASNFTAEIALVSCKAITKKKGIMDVSTLDAEIKRAFIQHANTVCLLVDSSKFDGVGLMGVCSLDKFDHIITDKMPSADWLRILGDAGVNVIYPGSNNV